MHENKRNFRREQAFDLIKIWAGDCLLDHLGSLLLIRHLHYNIGVQLRSRQSLGLDHVHIHLEPTLFELAFACTAHDIQQVNFFWNFGGDTETNQMLSEQVAISETAELRMGNRSKRGRGGGRRQGSNYFFTEVRSLDYCSITVLVNYLKKTKNLARPKLSCQNCQNCQRLKQSEFKKHQSKNSRQTNSKIL